LTAPVASEVPASSPGSFGSKATDLTGTLKWLVAAAGAIAAAIVAGLQLTAIANLQPWAAIIAACGAALALVAIGTFLLRATLVLAIQGLTVSELSNEEINAGVLEPSGPLDGKALPPLIAWVHERRTSLLGDATSITSLYTDGVIGARRALNSLRRGETAEWAGRNLSPESASDISWLEAEYTVATARVERLEEAAGYWERHRGYTNLIEAPIPAQIYVQNAESANVPSDCPATLSGQIVGGSLDEPIVVTTPTGSCPALKLEAQNSDLIVVPTGSLSPTGGGS
jgi:hypothetical protein